MTDNAPADEPSDRAGDDGATVVEVFERYFDPESDVSDDELREALDGGVAGTVVEVDARDNEVFAFVERSTDSDSEPIRDSYVVRRIVRFDGKHELDWTYLGRAQ